MILFSNLVIILCNLLFQELIAFCNSEYDRLRDRSVPSVNECYLWLPGVTTYGKVRRRWPGEEDSKVYDVHRWSYMVTRRIRNIPRRTLKKKLDVSHICHDGRCIRKEHLVLELHATNKERDHCFNQGFCCNAHKPHCIIVQRRIVIEE